MSVNEVQAPFTMLRELDGTALDDGYVYIGTAGSNPETSPITVYFDSGKAVTAPQPLRTTNGYISRNGSPANIFVDANDYSITIRDSAGSLVFTALNTDKAVPISDITGSIGSDQVSFLQAGTGAVSRTVRSKLRDIINVKDFGAVGDGVTDDTSAIQAAIDSIDTSTSIYTGGIVCFPMGEYVISSTIIMRTALGGSKAANLTLRGAGMDNTKLSCAAGFTGTDALYMEDSQYCCIEDIGIDGNDNADYGVHINNGEQISLNRVFVYDASVSGFIFDKINVLTAIGCRSWNPNGIVGFDFTGGGGFASKNLTFINCRSEATAASGIGFKIADVSSSIFISCSAEDAGYWGFQIQNVQSTAFHNCEVETCGRAAFYFYASAADDSTYDINGCRCQLLHCNASDTDNDGGSYGTIYSVQLDTSVIDVEIFGFIEISNNSTYSITSNSVTDDHEIRIEQSQFLDSISGVAAVIDKTDIIRTAGIAIANIDTDVPICNIGNAYGTNNMYSGLLHICATLNPYNDGSGVNLTSYVLLVTKSPAGGQVTEIAADGLKTGASASWPAFTFDVHTTNNQLVATPGGNCGGTFYFHITQLGGLRITNL